VVVVKPGWTVRGSSSCNKDEEPWEGSDSGKHITRAKHLSWHARVREEISASPAFTEIIGVYSIG
jgi:hypothetical protein